MIGLMLNNFYLMINTIKIMFAIIAMGMISYALYPEQIILAILFFIILFMLPISAFDIMTVTRTSKWNSVEKLMPVCEKKLLLSRYLTFLTLSIVAIGFIAVIKIWHSVILGVNLDETILNVRVFPTMGTVNFGATYGILTHIIGIIFFPLAHMLKQKKVDVILMISIGISFIVFYFVNGMNYFNIMFLFIVLYILSFMISYFFIKLEKANI